MDTCDVLIIGGGPGGAACAWHLRDAGLDVMVMDKAQFPRDKVCAGWITPQVIAALQIDADDYRRQRTFQPITGFRVGLIDSEQTVDISYDRPVSYGIRRCEFDAYLLRRTQARLALGTSVSSLRRVNSGWIVNERVKASVIVGAAGHFCPVARLMNPAIRRKSLVAAQEAEFALEPNSEADYQVEAATPELYFSQDLSGYGWCFRKQAYLNIGLGQLDARDLPRSSNAFAAFLKRTQRVPADLSWQWRGHAYLISAPTPRRVIDDGLLLLGDAAGIAYPRSGEGIRPAIESGLLAAFTIRKADGRYTRDRLQPYAHELQRRFGQRQRSGSMPAAVATLLVTVGRQLLRRPRFVRHVVIDRWFLNRSVPHLATLGLKSQASA